MASRSFLDTNILVYSFVAAKKDVHKQTICQGLLKSLAEQEICISTQVLNELFVTLKKMGFSDAGAKANVNFCIAKYNVLPVNAWHVQKAIDLRVWYNFSHWDCLIIAAAISSGCTTIYSEDMHSGMVVEGVLRLVNPIA